MKQLALLAMVTGICLAGVRSLSAQEERLGGIKLLPGYKHEPLQGIDSIVGRIVGPKGLVIHYEIGIIPRGPFAIGGAFVNAAKRVPKDRLRLYREQVIQGHPVHVAYLKDGTLIVTYPKSIPGKGINFRTKVSGPEQMADVLLMLLTFPRGKPAGG